ncbi:hypothetical protein PVC01_010023900 [Plasmodium vivax]|uniref:Uncharacterized protein n=1 Tax=Plasmodium vivax TaxID=5855 RepID=A0A1G4GR19_PLAVI|nr:hypothetical protein PVT01_010019800 [Plasmodium vivax]SCO70515.1 hypothetical protein PVC01_010023900 [Plasmodium vivax]
MRSKRTYRLASLQSSTRGRDLVEQRDTSHEQGGKRPLGEIPSCENNRRGTPTRGGMKIHLRRKSRQPISDLCCEASGSSEGLFPPRGLSTPPLSGYAKCWAVQPDKKVKRIEEQEEHHTASNSRKSSETHLHPANRP